VDVVTFEFENVSTEAASAIVPVRPSGGALHITQQRACDLFPVTPFDKAQGTLTIDACVTPQFEQHVRAVCGLPLGAPAQLLPAAMVNLLGDLWVNGEPD